MGALRFLRPRRDETAKPSATDEVAAGLDAFASESRPAGKPELSQPHENRSSRVAIGILAVAVLVEAVPTALWLGARFQPPITAAAPALIPIPPAPTPPPITVAAAPCEPTPSPAPSPASARAGGAARAAAKPVASVAPAMLAGVIAVTSPVPMRVYEQGRLVGTTEADSILLTAGRHELEFVNDSVGYRTRRSVTVQAGATAPIQLDPPMGTLHVNAVPWAEVWIDNERIGETPIGNLQMRIGTRQLVFRHPELGERRSTVLVTLKSPARVSMDLRNK